MGVFNFDIYSIGSILICCAVAYEWFIGQEIDKEEYKQEKKRYIKVKRSGEWVDEEI